MPQGKGHLKFAVVTVDYFTKWVEAEALATITVAKIEHFVWKNIICRFGLPNAIITNNGKQFDSSMLPIQHQHILRVSGAPPVQQASRGH